MEKLTYKHGEDNIFDYSFMDDFYCYSEDKTYAKKELFEKFNIEEVI